MGAGKKVKEGRSPESPRPMGCQWSAVCLSALAFHGHASRPDRESPASHAHEVRKESAFRLHTFSDHGGRRLRPDRSAKKNPSTRPLQHLAFSSRHAHSIGQHQQRPLLRISTMGSSSRQIKGWHVIIGDNGAGQVVVSAMHRSGALRPREVLGLRESWETWAECSVTRKPPSSNCPLTIHRHGTNGKEGRTVSNFTSPAVSTSRNRRTVKRLWCQQTKV